MATATRAETHPVSPAGAPLPPPELDFGAALGADILYK
jgi:hypothetical protein